MFKTFNEDRYYIERKYHNPEEPFDPHRRWEYHGYDYDESTGLDDAGIIEKLRGLEKETENLSHPVIKAKAVECVLRNTRIDINEHDYFIGFYTWGRQIRFMTSDKWYNKLFKEDLSDIKETMDDLNSSGATYIGMDFDHVVPDWKSLLELGFIGIRERARKYRKIHEEKGALTERQAAYFDGIEIEYTAIINFIDRLYKYANTKNHSKAKAYAECLLHLRDGAPTDFYEALQLIYIYFSVSESVSMYQVRSLGNGLDNSLYSFYKNDLSSGRYTRDEIKEFLAYFLMQWQSIGNYWGQPLYLGGTNWDGSTKVNELTHDIIDVYKEIEIYNPKIQIKVNNNTPDAFLNKIFNMIRNGQNSFVFCCEKGMMRAVMSYGATYEEALNMDIRGCYETGVRADEVSTATAYINSAKAVLYTLSNGYDSYIGKQVGIKTGETEDFETFEDFYTAFLKQYDHLIETSIWCVERFEKYLEEVNPSSMYSATVERSLQKGFDAYQGGVKFNNTAILNNSFATTVDSLMAIYEFVYKKKEITLTELKKALDNNWVGYEKLRAKILNSKHKYGNGDTLTDRYAAAVSTFFTSRVTGRKNVRGGVYKAIMHSALQFVRDGKKTGATPDGRRNGDELSKNASPSVGQDKKGVTALINSVIRLNPYTYPESFCLDVMLHPSAVKEDLGLKAMKSLLMTYMNGGGMSIQFNVFDTETLRDAQKHPEKYKNLQVRVCGWNALWNNLSEEEQNAYILRAENIQK